LLPFEGASFHSEEFGQVTCQGNLGKGFFGKSCGLLGNLGKSIVAV